MNCYNELCNLCFYTEFSTYNMSYSHLLLVKTLSGSWNLYWPMINLVGAWCQDRIMSGFGFLLASSKRTHSEISLFQGPLKVKTKKRKHFDEKCLIFLKLEIFRPKKSTPANSRASFWPEGPWADAHKNEVKTSEGFRRWVKTGEWAERERELDLVELVRVIGPNR